MKTIAFVSWQIVDDDDISGPQRWRQRLPNVFDEDRPVHGAVDDEGCCASVQPQPGHKGHRLPVPPGYAADDAATALGAAIESRHFGRGSGLINEDQLGRIEPRLMNLPPRPSLGHVRPLLFGRLHAFF